MSQQDYPFYFREATITDVDTKNFTCTLTFGDPSKGEVASGVPMPNLLGVGNTGLIVNLLRNTRVIAAYVHDKSMWPVVIVAVLPSIAQNAEVDLDIAREGKNYGTLQYPKTLGYGDIYISSHSGPRLLMKPNDSFEISATTGSGLFLVPELFGGHSLFSLSNTHITEGSGGRLSWGRVKRYTSDIGSSSIKSFFTDTDRSNKLKDIGFFRAKVGREISSTTINRNLPLSEYRMIINEFSTEFGFSGFDNEMEKIKNVYNAARRDPSSSRHRESTNSLYLSEGELVEIVGGNLVDINGSILDINYNTLPCMPVPTVDSILKFEELIKKSRRGIGYHFKLSTNIKSTDQPKLSKDFVFDIDKEGVLKVNIPKSSSTGNIPYVTDVNFKSVDNPRLNSVSPANPSVLEKIPVNLKDRNGEIADNYLPGTAFRETGVRFVNQAGSDPYFLTADSEGKNTTRVNTTKHHNIYAAAERLIANYVTKVSIPNAFSRTNTFKFPTGNTAELPEIPKGAEEYSYHSAFEVKYKPTKTGNADDKSNKTDVQNLFYSAVAVEPQKPAISTGGDTCVAGATYSSDDPNQPLISNYFKAESSDDGIKLVADKSKKYMVTHGGVSANVNMEGSLELSLGGDNVDNKSMILDTAGSLVMWLGKDKNDRSMIFQSDGDVLVNVGGTYSSSSGSSDFPTFNPGRFDLRVNVVDKGFHDTNDSRAKNGATDSEEPPYSSDYLISISDKGLVISGMKAGAPMVIRNDGPLMIESASDNIILKGNQVEFVEFAKVPTDNNSSKR